MQYSPKKLDLIGHKGGGVMVDVLTTTYIAFTGDS